MFTGIVEEIGRIASVVELSRARQFQITAHKVLADSKIDDSVCVSGVCLTVVALNEETFTVQAVDETLRKTTLGNLRAGSHVDGKGRVVSLEPQSAGKLMKVELPVELLRYVIPRGSIALEGVSLTVARLEDPVITIALIPHTLECTTLGNSHVGDGLNIEADLIGKHLERLTQFSHESGLTEAKLAQWGY